MLSAAVIVIVVPLVIYFGVLSQNIRSGRKAAALLSGSLAAYEQGIASLAVDPTVTGAIGGTAAAQDVYRLLYKFRNSQVLYSEFQLSGFDSDLFIGNNFNLAGVTSYTAANDIRLSIRMSARKDPVEHRITAGSSSINDKVPVFSINQRVSSGKSSGLLSFIFTGESFKQLLSGSGSNIIVTNEYSHIIYSELPFTANSYVFSPNKVAANVYSYQGDYFILSSRTIPETNITVYSLSSFSVVSSVIVTETALMLIVIILTAIFVYRTSFKLTLSTMAPFDSLATALDKFEEGDTNYRINGTGEPETQEYIDLFNGMLNDINHLIDKNRELTEQTRLFEVRLLYSQFNPHFMFNMLDNIKYTISTDDAKAREMVVSLSKMLRYTLDNVYNTEVPLELDIKYIEDYLALQKHRLGDMLSYSINVSPTMLYKEKLPKLVAQPLIENAINHGFTGEKPLNIDITVSRVKNDMLFVVKDDGQGLSKQDLNRIRSRLKRGTTSSPHIGLLNSHRRLRLLYGAGYGLTIESELNEGTTATLKIKLGDKDV